jgi:DNA-binding response OmpR family regulator
MSELSGKRLLLVEDHYDVAEMLLMYFSSHGAEVLHADNGAEGIELARTRFPNLILLDVMLPDMDGYDTCIQLRKTALTKYIPIIFLTQRDERADKVRGLELGADDYVTKPFDVDELRLRVRGSIRRATRENLHESRTGLPSGPLVQEELDRLEDAGYNKVRLKIAGFDAYRDVYSFMAANDVLKHAGKTIQEIIAEKGTRDDFVGILNNSFVVLTRADERVLERAIKDRFRENVKAFYTFVDADRGGILLNAGGGDERLVPLMTLEKDDEI